MEEELETNDANLRETTEKYVSLLLPSGALTDHDRLRQVDVKSEHFERRVAGLETERDAIEKKYEAMVEQFNATKAELEEMHKQLEDL